MGEAWQALSHHSNMLRTEDVLSSYTSVNFNQNTRRLTYQKAESFTH
jgi:hypothetical protein